MSQEKVTFSVSSKTLIVTALGAGVLAGAGTVYFLSRNQNERNLSHLLSQLNSTIQGVREDVANLENEIGLLRAPTKFLNKDSGSYSRGNSKKTINFDSRSLTSSRPATEWSYKTALDNSYLSDAASYKTATGYDTDYLSLDEDDEFFDIPSSEEENNFFKINGKDLNQVEEVTALSRLLREYDALVDGDCDQQTTAYNIIMDRGQKYSNNAEIMWRKAKATRNMAVLEEKRGNATQMKALTMEAHSYALEAIGINELSADSHKWFAIICGMRGQFSSTKDRIADGHTFKKHVDIALEINPNDSVLHHLLGRFCFEVSNLSWIEKKLATTLFGKVPESNYEEALNHFLSAEDSKSGKDNKCFIAKCLFQLQRIEEGKQWLIKASTAPIISPEDDVMQTEVEQLARAYSVSL